MDFQTVVRPSHSRAHREINANFATKVQYPGSHSWCVPTFPRNFQTDIESLDLSYRERWLNRRWNVGLPFLWVWGPSLQSHPQGKVWVKKELQASTLQPCVSLSPQYAGKDIFLWGRNGIKRECVFRPRSSRNCLAFNTGDLQTFPEDLTFKSRQCVSLHFLSLINSFLGHTATAHEDAGCGSVFESAGCYTVFT